MSNKLLDKQYNLLLQEEKRFAKRVTYLIRAQTPRPWWHIFVPFKFLFEYLTLKRDMRSFLANQVYLKQIALSAAYRSTKSDAQHKSQQEMQAELRDFCLHTQKIEPQKVYESLAQWMDLLFKHYCRLFETRERDYQALLRRAYNSAPAYQSFLEQLNSLERQIDQELQDSSSAGSLADYTRQRQKAIQEMRAREARDIFLA
jgi:hypothetical protein